MAKVYRGGRVESVHHGIACLANSQQVIKEWGDSSFSCYTRSIIKPIQAQAMLKSGLKLKGKELAIACASHQGSEEQRTLVKNLLDDYGFSEKDLLCGCKSSRRGRLPSSVHHNCSGKHAAILAACKINNWNTKNYLDKDHESQLATANEINNLLPGYDAQIAKDGCGLPTFYMQIAEMAKLFARLAEEVSYEEIIATMNEFPYLIGGPGNIDSILMDKYPAKFLAKVGAEGLVTVANLETKEALVLKIIDGSSRARSHTLIALLESIDWIETGSIVLDKQSIKSSLDSISQSPLL